jgi:hypothetical protein
VPATHAWRLTFPTFVQTFLQMHYVKYQVQWLKSLRQTFAIFNPYTYGLFEVHYLMVCGLDCPQTCGQMPTALKDGGQMLRSVANQVWL